MNILSFCKFQGLFNFKFVSIKVYITQPIDWSFWETRTANQKSEILRAN